MSEINQIKRVGKISDKTCPTNLVVWKIAKYFSLPQEVDYKIESPSFTFMDATWCLHLYPNGKSGEFKKWITLYVIKQHPFTSSHRIDYKCGIRMKDGWEHFVTKGKTNFVRRKNRSNPIRIKREMICLNKTLWAPQDTLRFFCRLSAKQTNLAKITTQTTVEEIIDDSLMTDFKDLFTSEENSDIIVRVKSQEFKAHKVILTARSPVFKSMFRHDMVEERSGVINITDCDPVAFRDFLSFLYCGRVEEFSAEKVPNLYCIADKYDVKQLKIRCVTFMMDNISVDNFSEIITLALQHNELKLMEEASSFFIENGKEIIATKTWLSFLKEYPVEANELYMKALK